MIDENLGLKFFPSGSGPHVHLGFIGTADSHRLKLSGMIFQILLLTETSSLQLQTLPRGSILIYIARSITVKEDT